MVKRLRGKPSPLVKSAPSGEQPSIARYVRPCAAALFGTLLVWAFLIPADSVSVFLGEALPQNLFWMTTGVLLCTAVLCRGGLRFSAACAAVCAVALAWLVLVTWLASDGNDPRRGWNGFWQVVSIAASYFVARGLAASNRSRSLMVSICLVGVIALSVHGLYQAFVTKPQDLANYLEAPGPVLQSLGIDADEGSAARKRFEDRLRSSEPHATFALANSLATLLTGGIVLSVGIGVGFWRRSSNIQSRWLVVTSIACALLVIAACWFLALSRTAYLAVFLAAGYWCMLVWLQRKPSRVSPRVVVGGLAVAVAVAGAGMVWLLKFNPLVLSEAGKSLTYRIEYWTATLEMIQEHGLFGIGLGNFQSYYPAYKLEVASEEIADPHNWILDIAATLSVPIAVFLLVWFAKLLVLDPLAERASDERLPVVPDESRSLLFGACVGGVACGGLLVLFGQIDFMSTVVSWPLGIVLVALVWPAVVEFVERDVNVLQTAVVAMLVCLLVNGSWQASGIAVPLVVLLAAGQRKAEWEESSISRRRIGPVLVLSGLGFLIFLFQTWLPVTNSWAKQQAAAAANSSRQRVESAKEAVAADPMNVQLLGWLAQAQVNSATEMSAGLFEREAQPAMEALNAWVQRDRNNFTTWKTAGDQALLLGSVAQELNVPADIFLQKSVSYYEGAVTRYPSSVQLHAQLAAAAMVAGQLEQFEAEFGEAVRLSEQSPHDDKKLNLQQIFLPIDVAGVERGQNSASYNAELLLNRLRISW